MENKAQALDNEQVASVIAQVRNFLKTAASVIDAFKRRADEIAAIIQPAIAQVHANIQTLPTRTREVQRNLGARGWYLSPRCLSHWLH